MFALKHPLFSPSALCPPAHTLPPSTQQTYTEIPWGKGLDETHTGKESNNNKPVVPRGGMVKGYGEKQHITQQSSWGAALSRLQNPSKVQHYKYGLVQALVTHTHTNEISK